MAQKEEGPKFRLETAAELLAKPQPEIDWLIENIWTTEGRGIIAGNPKVGKTWLALDMLISVASGQLCLGKYAVKQAPVLLVEEEGSALGLSRRLHGLARARGLKHSDLDKLFLITRQFARIPEDTTELFGYIFGEGIKLVVFDSLRRFHLGNENSSEEMQKVLDAFGKLSSLANCAVVLIHHLSKGQRETDSRPVFERLRGTGDFWAWCDCLIGMEGEEESDTAKCSFQFRDAESPEPIQIKRSIGKMTGAIGLEVINTAESEEFIEKSTQILDFMKTQYGSASENTIFKAIKGRKQDFHRVFRQMAKLGMVVRNGAGWLVPENAGTSGN